MEKEEIKQKILEGFQVNSLSELIAKEPKEWLQVICKILEEPFEEEFKKDMIGFSEDWVEYFSYIAGIETVFYKREGTFYWLKKGLDDKFTNWLHKNLLQREKDLKHFINKGSISLREAQSDFYNLSRKEFKQKYGTVNVC